jgi:hypothetical protein
MKITERKPERFTQSQENGLRSTIMVLDVIPFRNYKSVRADSVQAITVTLSQLIFETIQFDLDRQKAEVDGLVSLFALQPDIRDPIPEYVSSFL